MSSCVEEGIPGDSRCTAWVFCWLACSCTTSRSTSSAPDGHTHTTQAAITPSNQTLIIKHMHFDKCCDYMLTSVTAYSGYKTAGYGVKTETKIIRLYRSTQSVWTGVFLHSSLLRGSSKCGFKSDSRYLDWTNDWTRISEPSWDSKPPQGKGDNVCTQRLPFNVVLWTLTNVSFFTSQKKKLF